MEGPGVPGILGDKMVFQHGPICLGQREFQHQQVGPTESHLQGESLRLERGNEEDYRKFCTSEMLT